MMPIISLRGGVCAETAKEKRAKKINIFLILKKLSLSNILLPGIINKDKVFNNCEDSFRRVYFKTKVHTKQMG
jgi:hypothetical protein